MIAVYAKIPYLRQLAATDPEPVEALRSAFRGAAADFGASLHAEDEGLLLAFDEARLCARLRAAEALRVLAAVIGGLAARLHGWVLLADRTQDEAPAAAAALARRWLSLFEDGVYATGALMEVFGPYLEVGPPPEPLPVLGFPAARQALPEGWLPPSPDGPLLERLTEELDRHLGGESGAPILAALGPGEGPKRLLLAALAGLQGEESPPLVLRAGTDPAPLGPFLVGLPPPEEEGGAGLPAARYVATSPWRRLHSPAIQRAFAVYVRARLETWARSRAEGGAEGPAVVLLERLDAFPKESLVLLAELLAPRRPPRPRSATGRWEKIRDAPPPPLLPVFVASSAAVPAGLEGIGIRTLAVPPPGPKAMAESAIQGSGLLAEEGAGPFLAALAAGDPFRLMLGLRLASSGGDRWKTDPTATTEALVAAVLAALPPEFGAYLYALSLAEEALTDAALLDFLDKAGFARGIRPLLEGSLGALGLIEGGRRPRLARVEVARAPGRLEAWRPDIDRIFTTEILALHASRKIRPSLALHRRIAGTGNLGAGSGTLLLDCIAADAAFGPSEEGGEGPHRGLLAAYLPVVEGLASDEGPGPALAAFEESVIAAGRPPLESAILALARAAEEFGKGASQAAASRVRPALMSLHELGARRAEARAHRILGLCSLASHQVQEGVEYLSNAVDLASLVPDHLEVFFAALAAAGADFVLGDLRRTEKWQATARAMAEAAFRLDWCLACDFLEGRLAFELGRYGAAEDRFLELAAKAEELDELAALRRARIWAGRAAGYGGAGPRAQELLLPEETDAEASWFLGELAAWEGDWRGAAAKAGSALAKLPRRDYRPTDALVWDSGFDPVEGSCLGPGPGSPYLEDQVRAFSGYVRAMAEGDPSLLGDITSRSRDRRLALLHPQAHLYDYYAYLVCETFTEGPVDAGSLLSRAWKALQMRTMRMSDAATKASFLEANRWNREIVAAARGRRLV